MIGTTGSIESGATVETLTVIEANVDDATGEVLADTVARLLDAGALDAWLTPIVMKKGRPAFTIHALAMPESSEAIRDTLAHHTGTLGVRTHRIERWRTERHMETVQVGGLNIAIKVTNHRAKAEFEDASRVAHATGRPVREVIAEAEAQWRLLQDPGSEGPSAGQRR
jgi:uncharacterized protein (DUF111 family)